MSQDKVPFAFHWTCGWQTGTFSFVCILRVKFLLLLLLYRVCYRLSGFHLDLILPVQKRIVS